MDLSGTVFRSGPVVDPTKTLLSRPAGDTIAQLTDVGPALPSRSDGPVTVFSDRTGMVKAARLLLSSVTKVLVLADRIVIKQIITSRNKVRKANVTRDRLLRLRLCISTHSHKYGSASSVLSPLFPIR